MSKLLAFIKLSRPHFLLGGLLMFALGASTDDSIDVFQYVIAQVMISATQLTAHYVNEFADYEADKTVANRTAFSGGSGVLVSGLLSRRVAAVAAQTTTVVAVVLAAVVATFSPLAALTGVLALCVSWAYSMPPVRLLDTGWGEIVTAVTVACLVPMTGTFAQNGGVDTPLLCMMAALTMLQFAMLLAFELPDLDTDKTAGKRVLGVRLGEKRTILLMRGSLYIAALLGAIAYGLVWVAGSTGWIAVAAFASGVVMLSTAQIRKHRVSTFAAVAMFFLCGCAFTLGQV